MMQLVVLFVCCCSYKIVVSHGEHEWTVRRRYKHFRQLHDALALFRAKYRLPLPRTGGYVFFTLKKKSSGMIDLDHLQME